MIVGIAQMSSKQDVAENIATSRQLTADAASRGARWVLFPENTPFLGQEKEKLAIMEPLDGEIVSAYRQMARDHGVWLTLGSFAEVSPDPERTFNTQLLLEPSGDIAAVYRKIHLFDAQLPSGQVLMESDAIVPGDAEQVVVHPLEVDGERWMVGLTICYDVRFPELYRALLAQGAEVLTVPSAFTVPTGHAHWLALLKARAIENQCYVVAPDQWGNHAPTRRSFGHSVAFDPWGRQVALAPERACVITAELDRATLERTRQNMPVRRHARLQELS